MMYHTGSSLAAAAATVTTTAAAAVAVGVVERGVRDVGRAQKSTRVADRWPTAARTRRPSRPGWAYDS
eukprot:COSAG02_NODE_125_length_34972_cov_101.069997_21_plen_68_part_00